MRSWARVSRIALTSTWMIALGACIPNSGQNTHRFVTGDTESSEAARISTISAAPSVGLQAPQVNWQQLSTGSSVGSVGSVARNSVVAPREINIPLSLSFGQLSAVLLENWKGSMIGVRETDCQSVKADEYRCGELPFGRIESTSRKEILTIRIPEMQGSKDDTSFKTDPTQARVLMSRTQSGGTIELPLLDSRSQRDAPVSAQLGDDLFIRLQPRSGEMIVDLCMSIPGLTIQSPAFSLKGTVKKSIPILPDIKSSFDSTVRIGSAKLGVARACSSVKIRQVGENRFDSELLSIDPPQYDRPEFVGMQVEVDNRLNGAFWKIVNSFTKVFGYNLENRIAEAVQAESERALKQRIQLKTSEIQSGEWLKKYVDEAKVRVLLKSATQQFNRKLSSTILSPASLQATIDASCTLGTQLLTGTPELLRALFFNACRSSTTIKLKLIDEHADSRRKQCYDFYFNPSRTTQSPRPWWSASCFVGAEAKIQFKGFDSSALSLPVSFEPLINCLSPLWANQRPSNPVSLATACQTSSRDILNQLGSADLNQVIASGNQMQPPSDQQLTAVVAAIEAAGIASPGPERIRTLVETGRTRQPPTAEQITAIRSAFRSAGIAVP